MTVPPFPRLLAALTLSFAASACHNSDQPSAPPQTQTPPAPPSPATNAAAEPATPPLGKPKITKLDDLPRYTYPVQGSAVDLVTSDAQFAPFAAQVRANLEKDLSDYDIEDKTTLKNLKGSLLTLDLVEGKNDEARQLIQEMRDLEDKPALKIMTGFITEVRLDVQDRMKITNLADLNQPAFQQAFQTELTTRTSALPWNVVQDELKGTKGSFELVSRNLVLGEIQSEIDPVIQKTGSISNDLAGTLVHLRSSLLLSIPLKAPIVNALGTVIKAHSVAKADIWPARAVTLTPNQKLTPVVIGIWDSGVDPTVYPKKIFVDPQAPGDGGDRNGLAYDLHSNRVHGDLYPLGADAKRLPELKSQIKGILDMEAAVESPEADALKKKMAALPQDQVKPFLEDLELFGNYIHGTHVAGIASQGNPAAQLLVARITFDYHLIPEKPTVAQAKKDVLADQATVDYFKQHHVRVVNMSWGGSLKDVEEALEKNGVGDATERKKEAREIFDIGKDGLYNALKSAPDILFITAAGNSDNDVNFDEVVPSSFSLPNLISVGAVDQAGEETSFTSFGKNVIAYADGFEVDSPIPGGSHLKLSGTSMASPEVANLAAKLFALNPKLTPADVIGLIKDGLEANPTDKRILLLNPKKSIEALQANPLTSGTSK
jgi:subtilisin family serine protease